jgi:anti-sigma B factor antagonist
MDITTSLDGTTATIVVAGKLTVATSPSLEEAVQQLADTATDFDIDLTDLEYISSAGLRVLVSTQKLATQRGGSIRLLHPTEDVNEVFEMTGLSEVMTIIN